MATFERNRVIRESTRQPSSPFRVSTDKVGLSDTLIVNISHESSTFRKTFKFTGREINGKKSIHFKAVKSENSWEIKWIGI